MSLFHKDLHLSERLRPSGTKSLYQMGCQFRLSKTLSSQCQLTDSLFETQNLHTASVCWLFGHTLVPYFQIDSPWCIWQCIYLRYTIAATQLAIGLPSMTQEEHRYYLARLWKSKFGSWQQPHKSQGFPRSLGPKVDLGGGCA